MAKPLTRRWLDYLSDEDLAFVKRLVLASGSLKEIAAGYGISYPTVRLRLDRLIAKITVTDSQDFQSDFERVLRVQHAEGNIDADTLKTLLAAYRAELEDRTASGFSHCLVWVCWPGAAARRARLRVQMGRTPEAGSPVGRCAPASRRRARPSTT